MNITEFSIISKASKLSRYFINTFHLRNKHYLYLFLFLLGAVGFQACAIEDIEYKKFNNFTYKKYEKNDTRVTLNVTLDNPNKFKVKIVKSDLVLSISGYEAGKVKLVDKVTLKKKAEDAYNIIVSVDPEQIGKAVLKGGLTSLLTGKVSIRLKGWVKGRGLGIGVKVDVDETHQIDISRIKSF